jgi:hypothetical protein
MRLADTPELSPLWRARDQRLLRLVRKFQAFVAAVGHRPVGATIGRKDHNRGYEPSNVQWMTRREQDHPDQIELPLQLDAVQLLLPLEGFVFRSARSS